MLTCLRVRDFAIIEEVEVELGAGLTVITGETGAGKSILVDALELVLGARGRPEVVRTGAEQAEVEALFDVAQSPELVARLETAGFDAGGELVVRRIVQAGGRTRAYVNGRLATAGQLTELAAGLADISSQHEHHTLVDPSTHLECLDAFGKLGILRNEVEAAHRALAAATAELAEVRLAIDGRDEREDLLRFQIREIDELALVPGEKGWLREERERLRHAERLTVAAGGAEDALYARDASVCRELARLGAELRDAARIDAKLAEPAAAIDAAHAMLEEAARELGRYARTVAADPERLAELDERLDRIARLERKYGKSEEAVLEHRALAASELEALGGNQIRMGELEDTLARAREAASRAARALSEKRRGAAEKLGKAIGLELASLGMGGARVLVEVVPIAMREGEGSDRALEVDGARLTATGIDRVELLIAANKGEEARPLRRIASGGELSRAMLAVKRVLAGVGPAGVYVFDEVDAGVGGAVAETIGRKLRDVARHQQVICVTHLPQIAVFADTHFRVQKEVERGRTKSSIDRLGTKDRLEEIARMLGELKITPKTRAAAAEMLEEARRA